MTIETILVAFVALTAFALLVQAFVMVAILFSAKKAVDKLRVDFEELRESALPFFNASRDALARIAPKIEPITADLVKAAENARVISGDLAVVTTKVRGQVEGIQESTTEIVDKFRVQAVRADALLTRALDIADRAGAMLQSAIGVPARQLAAILAAAKAVIESLRGHETAQPAAHTSNDNETFI
jgi:hypothetical protein